MLQHFPPSTTRHQNFFVILKTIMEDLGCKLTLLDAVVTVDVSAAGNNYVNLSELKLYILHD